MQFKRKRGDRVGRHRHENEQAGYCLSGRFKLTIEGQEGLIEPGDSYLIPGGAEHS